MQAARVNGAGRVRTLFEITIPLLRPVFVYATLVCLLLALGQFSGPLMLGRRENIDVVTTEMYLLTREFPVNYPLGRSLCDAAAGGRSSSCLGAAQADWKTGSALSVAVTLLESRLEPATV